MLRLLADTCIWLDLVKDCRHEPVLSAVDHLVDAGTVSLVVPRLVVEEFARRKDEVVRGRVQGIATTLKRARDVVAQFGTDGGRPAAMAELHDVDPSPVAERRGAARRRGARREAVRRGWSDRHDRPPQAAGRQCMAPE